MATVKDVLKHNMAMGREILLGALDGLEDAELLKRSVPNANHTAWQLGHVIASEHAIMSGVGQKMRPLPDGFAEAHGKESASSNDPRQFKTKAEYLALLQTVREDSLKALESLSDADLDRPGPESMRAYIPTVMAAFNLLGGHEMIHSGQITPVRRLLGKPNYF